ncbi:hypothetical protein D5018_20525 [Parashewanella curva]|uniref:Uncharacterized protein n=1 Tax=Parashewanella curva TaxID=2338552 RepID=A0A3L8PR04_9GAMM|nr:hypothetical protein [Parashewanella curva]RLV57821.1 hypothetical protein D5018_20525 [Parashewanella curva]
MIHAISPISFEFQYEKNKKSYHYYQDLTSGAICSLYQVPVDAWEKFGQCKNQVITVVFSNGTSYDYSLGRDHFATSEATQAEKLTFYFNYKEVQDLQVSHSLAISSARGILTRSLTATLQSNSKLELIVWNRFRRRKSNQHLKVFFKGQVSLVKNILCFPCILENEFGLRNYL